MGWFKRKSSDASAPAQNSISPIPITTLPTPRFQITPSVTDESSQASTTSFFLGTRPPIRNDTAASTNVSPLLRRNTAPPTWITRLAGLLSGIQAAKELIGPLTDICAAIGIIVQRKRKIIGHKASWGGVFAVLEGHRRTFGEYVNLFISEDAQLEPESPLLTPLRSYASELENMVACLLTESGSGARSMRGASLSQGIWSNIETFEHFAVTADWVVGYSGRLNGHLEQFLLSAALCAGVFTPAIQNKLKKPYFEPSVSTAHRVVWAQGLHHSECLTDTRVATLNTIDKWASNVSSKARVFCLVGFEGTGKSTVANHMARKWQSEGRLAARFFFSQGFTGASSAYDLPPYLASTLRDNFPDMADQLQQAQGDLNRVTTLSIADQWSQLVVPSLRLINDKSRILVVDGLNECSADSRQRLLECILETGRSSETLGNIKFFLTTRNDPTMERLLAGAGDAARVDSMTFTALQKRATLHDISLYVQHRMSHIQELGMSDQDYEDLVTRSDGCFMFAATACTILLRSRHRRACLGRIVKAEGPNALDALYLSTLRYANELDEACSVAQVKLFLSIVIAIRKPLPFSIVTALLSKTTPAINVTRIIDSLAGIVSGGIQGEPIGIIHSTFREFLLKASLSQEYSINLNMAHATLASSCLSLLLQGLKTDICSLSTPGELLPLNKHIRKLEVKINNCVSAAVQYAALNWTVHALSSIHNPRVSQLVRQFFNKSILNWLELGFLCGQGSAYVVGLQGLQVGIENSLLLKHSCVNETDNQWCLDTIQFTQTNKTLLGVSVLQLYTSGIAFTPSSNLIGRNYAPIFKHVLPSIPRDISTAQNGPLVLTGHKEPVTCVTYSFEGSRLVSGSNNGTLILWDTETGAQISQLAGFGSSIGCLSYSPRGNFVIYGAADGYIRKWDGIAGDATEIGYLDKHESISSLSWSPNGFEVIGGTSSGSLWGIGMLLPSDLNDYGRVHSDSINCVAYSPAGTTVASASSDHTVQIWFVETLERSAVPKFVLEHASPVHCVAFSPTRPVLATGTDYFHIWKVETGQEIFRGILEGTLRCLSYSPDGSQIITTHGSHIRQRETNTRSFTGSKFEGHTADVTCVSYSPKGDFITSGSQDQSLRIWNLCHSDLDQSTGHKTMVTSLSYSQDGGTLASAASDGTFCLWNVEKAILKLGPIHTPLGRINAIAYSSTADLVACAGAACYVGLWSTKSGVDTGIKLPRIFEAMSVTRISFSPNGGFITVKADLAQDLLFVWAIRTSNSSMSLKLVMRINTDGQKYAFHPSSNFICIGDQAWSLQSHPPKLALAGEGLRGILAEAFISEISYRHEYGFDWVYVGAPPRQSFAIPNQFNVVCHATHSKVAALAGEDGHVVFIDCHHLAAQVGWRLNSHEESLTLNVNSWIVPTMEEISSNLQNYNLTGQVSVVDGIAKFNGNYSSVLLGALNGRYVAIKVIKATSGQQNSTVHRKLLREVVVWGSATHRNIHSFYGFATDHAFGPFGALISPWCSNGDANQHLSQNGPSMLMDTRVNLWRGVVEGIAYLHGSTPPIVHGDIKPGNVLIDDAGQPKICDFGLARILVNLPESGLTTTSEHTGTTRYLAPELVNSDESVPPTISSDLYALGCLGLDFIYLQIPFAHRPSSRQGHIKILQDLKRGVPPATSPPHRNWPSQRFWPTISRLWNLDPLFRPSAFSTAQAVMRTETTFPPNVVQRIIAFVDAAYAGGISRDIDARNTRTHCLRNLCLVSRAYCAWATPVLLDGHHLAPQLGWRLNSHDKAPTLNFDPSIDAVPDGESNSTLNGNDFGNSNGSNSMPIPSDSQRKELQDATFDGVSTTSNVPCAVPDLTGSVHKRKPIFNGTYSTVYEGELDGKKVAIKALRAVNSLHAMRRKYRRELETWWRLVHPNVTPLLGSIEDEELGDFGILISPWAEMGNAANYIELDINYSQRVSLFHDVCKGLKYLHEFNPTVVHADLKPANVLIDGDGTARLCDFGLVRIVQKEANIHTGTTTTTAHAGAARYLAYELVESLGDNLPTTASDIHALACVGMEFIYICPPYAEIRPNQALAQLRICQAIGTKMPPVVRPNGITGIVVDLWNTFETCWSLEPSFRPSADELCGYLAENGAALAAGLAECEACIIEPRELFL